MLEIISLPLNLFRLVFCPSMLSVLENVPCAFKKNVYSDSLDVNSWKYQLSINVLLFHLGSLLTYWFSVLQIYLLILEGGCLSLLVLLYSCQFLPLFVSICFIYLSIPILSVYMLTNVISSFYIDPFTFM